MTRLVVSVTGPTLDEMRAQARQALAAGADAVELRLDLLSDLGDDGQLDPLLEEVTGRCVVTCRPIGQGGHFDGGEQQRLARLIYAGRAISCAIDFEFDALTASANVRQKLLLAARKTSGAIGGTNELILSHHDCRGRPADLQRIAAALSAVPEADVVKIAWHTSDVCDNFVALDLVRSLGKPAAVLCMGADGLASRVLAGKVGAAVAYCALEPGGEAAAGQLSLAEMTRTFRWEAIDAETKLYGLVGDPVAHSLSPRIHNAAFDAGGVHAVYLPFRVSPGWESFHRFVCELTARPWLHAAGLSVTIPQKQNALHLAGGGADETARRVGAVNTLHFREGGVRGYNTDYEAIRRCLCDALGGSEEPLRGLPAAVLGAGGVARAAVAALVDAGCRVAVYNRTADRAAELAADFACRVEPWEARTRTGARLIVNCTPIGLWPDSDASPLPPEALRSDLIVFDTVYNPATTKLLSDAAAAGATGVTGLSMFLHQAARQFELWTGQPAPREAMAQAARSSVQGA